MRKIAIISLLVLVLATITSVVKAQSDQYVKTIRFANLAADTAAILQQNGKLFFNHTSGKVRFMFNSSKYSLATDALFGSSLRGLVPASGGGSTNFLRADGTWAAPTGLISGLTATRIPVAASATSFTDYPNFTYTAASDRVNVLNDAGTQTTVIYGGEITVDEPAQGDFITVSMGNGSDPYIAIDSGTPNLTLDNAGITTNQLLNLLSSSGGITITTTGSIMRYGADYTESNPRDIPDKDYVDTQVAALGAITGTLTSGLIPVATGVGTLGNSTISFSGTKATFTPNASTVGLNIGTRANAPSSLVEGDVYYDTGTDNIDFWKNGGQYHAVNTTGFSATNYIPYVVNATTSELTSEAAFQYDPSTNTMTVQNITNGAAGLIIEATSSGDVNVVANGNTINLSSTTIQHVAQGDVELDAQGGASSNVKLVTVKTSDPSESGAIWSSNGYAIISGSGAAVLKGSATIDFGSLSPGDQLTDNITVTGAAAGDVCAIGTPGPPTGVIYTCYVSASNTVTVLANNAGLLNRDPASATFKAIVFK